MTLRFRWVLLVLVAWLVSCGAGSTDNPRAGLCAAGQTQCGTACVDLSTSNTDCGACGTACSAGSSCVAGTCTCQGGLSNCDGTCVNTTSNAASCGSCTTACSVGQSCSNGSCSCPAGWADCGSGCVDTSASATACGACGVACETGEACTADACTCLNGLTLCGTSCVDVQSDGSNCGTCGQACAAGQVCSNGQCSSAGCDPLTQCGQDCVDLQTSVAHCGSCDTACPAGQSCSGGACTCPSGQTLCNGACVDSQSDAAHCGNCTTACAAGQTCTAGACNCSNNQTLCGSNCTDTTGDPANCGACGTACTGGRSCVGSSCTCPNNGTFCNGACVNTQTDTSNCGSCGNKCASGATCASGACNGGTGGTGGTSGTGGTGGTGGSTGGTGGTGGSTGGSGGTGGSPTCDPGTTTTTWATGCQTAPSTTCVAGTWTDPGSTTNDPLVCQSAHFAVHSPTGTITAAQCTAATDTLENVIWPTYFGSPIFFPEPYCNTATKYKASIVIHTDYGLTGGGWGNGYMGMWVGPGATADHWGLAHEFMHSVQSQNPGLRCGGNTNYCGWIYESHANFMPHQLSEYRTDVHCSEMLFNAPHMYLGSTRDRYCNWQFMEYLKDKYCYKAVNQIWTTTTSSNDPFTNIAATRGWSTSQLNDFFIEWAMHNITWDYKDPAPTVANNPADPGAAFRNTYKAITDKTRAERRLRVTALEPLDTSWATNRRFESPYFWAPQRWGYNVVRLYPDANATSVTVTFRGVTQTNANSDWRWGLVSTDTALTKSRYSAIQRGSDGELTFCLTAGESLWLVVMGTPSTQQHVNWDQAYPTIYRYPYMVQFANAWPEGFQNGTLAACSGTLVRHGNGNGCAPSSLASSVYVGPYAQVVGGTVSGTARIEDHATVVSGTVSGGTVGALSLINNFTVAGTAKAQSTFYPLGFFEGGQGISGTAWLYGDLEYRGQGLNESSGSYYGFVDNTTASETINDVTVAPPYTWR